MKRLKWQINLILNGTKLYLRFPKRRDCKNWIELREKNREYLKPWEPIWAYDHVSKAGFHRYRKYAREVFKQNRSQTYFIFRKFDDAMIGSITLSNIRFGVTQAGYLGYWLGEQFSAQGYMKEALSCVIEHSFNELKLNRLEAATLPENIRSQKLLQSLHFVEEGYLRQLHHINGKFRDHIFYALLKQTWHKTLN